MNRLGLLILCLVTGSCSSFIRTETTFDNLAPVWEKDKFPLDISCHGYSWDRDRDCRQMVGITNDINRRLGFDVYSYRGHARCSSQRSVCVIIGVPQDVGNGIGKNESGDLYHSGEFFELRGFSGEASRCELRTSTTGDTSMLWASLYHGLGHCLGLGHDDFALSIMRPLQVYDGKSMPWITDRDRSAIRNRYAMD